MLGDSREILGSFRKVLVFPREMLVWFLQGGTSLLCADAWSCKDFLGCPMEMLGCSWLMLLFHREVLGSSKKVLERNMEMLRCVKDILI